MKMIGLIMVCAAVLAAQPAQGEEELNAPGTALGSAAIHEETLAASPAQAAAPAPELVKGYRGTTLPVGGDQALYIKKGDRVDVLVTFDAKTQEKGKQERKEKITATILQNVVVLNVRRPEKVDDLGAVELLLNPVEAQYAALSIAQGGIHIAVRAVGDVELHPMEMASFRKLIQ